MRAHGKFIVTGEYSVIDGGAALVVPLLKRGVATGAAEMPGSAREVSAPPEEFVTLIREKLGLPAPERLYADLPLAAGLGGSAAVAVALARQAGLAGRELWEAARELENFFHHRSSGADVAGALADVPIIYQSGHWKELPGAPGGQAQNWGFWLSKPFPRHKTVRDAVREASSKPPRFSRVELDEAWSDVDALAAAMNRQGAWFEETGRIPQEMKALIVQWKRKGALALKPTGAGYGGVLLGLFERKTSVEQGSCWWSPSGAEEWLD